MSLEPRNPDAPGYVPPGWRARRAEYLRAKHLANVARRAKRRERTPHAEAIAALKCLWFLVPRNKRKAGKKVVR